MIPGLDIASVDGNVQPDWKRVRAAGYSFVYLRAHYGVDRDRQFAIEWPRLKAEAPDLVRGAYLFLRWDRDAEAQAQAFYKTVMDLGYTEFDLPLVVDVEFPHGRAATGLTAAEAIGRVIDAVELLEARLGTEPMLYTSARVWREDLDDLSDPRLTRLPLWLARYAPGPPPLPQPWEDNPHNDVYWIHQFAGDAHKVPGLSGTADLNHFYAVMYGEYGPRVRWIQYRLGIDIDGVFGPAMTEALRRFQAENGLLADAIVGPRTFARLAWCR